MPAKKKDLKLLFVNPCLRPGGYTKLLPVGLASVMTYFNEKNYKFSLLDIDINEYDDAYVENYIKKNHFDFVLLGTLVTHYKWVKWFVNMIKKHQPKSCVITGNSVAGSIPEVFLNNTKGDIVVTGEGEISAYETVEAIRLEKDLKTVEGISFRDDNGNVTTTEHRKVGSINDFPMINWNFFEVERYMKKPTSNADKNIKPEDMRAMPVITARGCAFKCSFCHYVFWDDPYRNRSPKEIVDEIEHLMKKYDVKYIEFWDDLSFASAITAEKLCDEIISRKVKVKWNCAIRVDIFTRARLSYEDSIRIAKKMNKAGCYQCGFSLESGNKQILEMMNKKIEVDAFYTTVYVLREAGIIVDTSVIFGYPIETKETIKETFDQCFKAGIYPSIGFLLPLPYTAMYDYAKANGFITDEDKYLESITERQDICINLTKMTDDEVMSAIKEGAKKLNDALELGLNENTYIKTGGATGAKAKKKKKLNPPMDPEMKRIENDVTFNYSRSEFKFEEQPKTSSN